MTAPVQPTNQPGGAWTPPQGPIWNLIRQGMSAIRGYPQRLKSDLQGQAQGFLQDPMTAWTGMVGPGELGGTGGLEHAAIFGRPKVMELAQELKKNGGFTFDPRKGELHSAGGYAVANPPGSKSVVLNPNQNVIQGLQKAVAQNKDLLGQEGMMLGGWKDPDTGKHYLEVSHVTPSKEEALDLAKQRNEKAIFDLGTFENVPNPHYKEPLSAGTMLPKDEITPTSWALAHHTAGTTDQKGWMANVSKDNPTLGERLKQTPDLATKLYARSARHKDFAESLRKPEEVDSHLKEQMGKSPDSAPWYKKWMSTMNEALGPDLASKFTNASSHLSARVSPEQETGEALKALDLWSRGQKITTGSLGATQLKVDKVNAAFAGERSFKLGGGKPPEQKTADYNLARRGFEGRGAVDRHMQDYYAGKKFTGTGGGEREDVEGAITPAQREVLQGRMESDARRNGMSVPDFQAAIWAHQTGYAAGFGEKGATAEDWVRHHLAMKPEFQRLLGTYPGLQKLRMEGLMKGIEKEKGAP
jgi:hypothetical protein